MSKHSILWRSSWLWLACACSVDPGGGMPFSGSGAEGGATNVPDDDDTGESSGSSSGGESGSGGADAATLSTTDSSSGDDGATITTTDASTDAQESSGVASLDDGGSDDGANEDDAYQACGSNDECTSDPGLACLTADNGGEGFCSPPCGSLGQTPPDPQLCPDPPPGVTATVVCLEGLIRSCALSCAGDLTCPAGTECLPANNGGGPYCFGSAM